MAQERPFKRSLTIRGHRTSVSLEPEFWTAFREIAAERGISANQLAATIDEQRDMSDGLASSLRVFVLQHFRNARPDPPKEVPGSFGGRSLDAAPGNRNGPQDP